MIRMAHKIVTGPVMVGTSDPGIREALQADVDIATKGPVIIADDVATFWGENPKVSWDLTKDVPCAAPPADSFVIEWLSPLNVVTAEGTKQDTQIPMATCIAAMNASDVPADQVVGDERRAILAESKWILRLSYYAAVPAKPQCGRPARFGATAFIPLREDGSIITCEIMDPHGDFDDTRAIITQMNCIALLALSFVNCKNIRLADATAEQGPTEKWLRRQKAPVIEYKILDITPMREVLRTEGDMAANGPQKALHICRGHFATYTDASPLFGKYTGRFWKPQHVRGDIERGAVVKDYSVRLP